MQIERMKEIISQATEFYGKEWGKLKEKHKIKAISADFIEHGASVIVDHAGGIWLEIGDQLGLHMQVFAPNAQYVCCVVSENRIFDDDVCGVWEIWSLFEDLKKLGIATIDIATIDNSNVLFDMVGSLATFDGPVKFEFPELIEWENL